MEVKQQLNEVGQQLQQAVLQAAMGTEDSSSEVPKVRGKREGAVSPLSGAPVPAGRQKGTPNRVTKTIREAVEKAARDCHKDGLAGWLIERAQGSLGDRQIFAQMVNKAMPLQVQAQVAGGVQIQLSWLGQRQIGTTVAQSGEQRPQVLDLQAESDGTYRIIDPVTPPAGGGEAAGATDEKAAGDAQGG